MSTPSIGDIGPELSVVVAVVPSIPAKAEALLPDSEAVLSRSR